MKSRIAVSLICAATLLSSEIAKAQSPSSLTLPAPYQWAGGEPVQELGFQHGRVCLNGVWRFQPAPGIDAPPLATPESWGAISVPGSWSISAWNGHVNLPGLIVLGQGDAWTGAMMPKPNTTWYDPALAWKAPQAWYERSVTIPKQWQGRQVALDLRRVSTDAQVYLDGHEIGSVKWPYGAVDLPGALQPGSTHALRILVTTRQTEAQVLKAMGVGQNALVDAKLDSRGIIGDVFLTSRPMGARIDDVWVKTSVRKHELSVDVDLSDIKQTGPVEFIAVIKDSTGKIAKTFRQTSRVKSGDSTVPLAWPWTNPKLWDFRQPNLYTLELSAKSSGPIAGYRQVFGFRELWIQGKEIFLNGTPFRLRPTSTLPDGPQAISNGNVTVLSGELDDIMRAGFNCVELWPRDYTVRGTFNYREVACEMADRKGMPLIGPALSAVTLFSGASDKWNDSQKRADWEKALNAEWRRYRNYPSILMWATTANVGGYNDDQDPRRIGRRLSDPAWSDQQQADPARWKHHQGLDEMTRVVKRLDPTRPVLVHQAGPVGDIYAVNNYLNLLPLQEREEWLSDWKQNGTMPYTAIEFGTPLDITMNRGRDGYTNSSRTEWLMTEFCASYFGRDAYGLEQPEYRDSMSKRFLGNQLYNWLGESGQGIVDYAPAFQDLEQLFITNTWRSWRTMGITAGMIPWSEGHGFKPIYGQSPLPAFQAGQRGTWFPTVPTPVLSAFGTPGAQILPAGKALLATNGPTLAWICGPSVPGDAADFTAKDHSFYSGAKLAKRVALLNDTRSSQMWSVTVTASCGSQTLGTVKHSGRIGVGQTIFVPIEFMLPPVTSGKSNGEIRLQASVGTDNHTDTFAFRVFAPAQSLSAAVQVFDPTGETTALLKHLGMDVSPWQGGPTPLLVIGRGALSDGKTPPSDLESYVKSGGRLVIMAQDPVWMEKNLGLRYAHVLTRRVFRLDNAHPIVSGLDEQDLRDWTGSSTLVNPKPDYRDPTQPRHRAPTWGWRWGGRGAVTSVAIEKPHRAGWRPLLECEFDLAYSPLMELSLGQGEMVLCTLDLEDHVPQDPAAELLARNLFTWVPVAPMKPRVTALYVGNDSGAKLLDLIGCDYRRGARVEATAPLVILGPDVSADAALSVLDAGGSVFVLPRQAPGDAGLGVKITKQTAFLGSLTVPTWDEARGLSPSDMRWRNKSEALLLSGSEVGSDGLLARVTRGHGVAIFSQSDPLAIPADTKDYLRYTRWRETRTLTQLIANLGGAFKLDNRVLHSEESVVSLADSWKVAWTNKLPTSPTAFADPGLSAAASALIRPDANESAMEDVSLPTSWQPMSNADGEAVFRKHVTLPTDYAGQDLALNLGIVDDFDAAFVNGVQVGKTTSANPNWWTIERTYKVPAGILKPGDNVIAVRVFDNYGGGGFNGPRDHMNLVPYIKPLNLYHPDYRTDFALGDDPYRYFRW